MDVNGIYWEIHGVYWQHVESNLHQDLMADSFDHSFPEFWNCHEMGKLYNVAPPIIR